MSVLDAERVAWLSQEQIDTDRVLESGKYLLVDDIPEVYTARQEVRFAAEALLENRRQARAYGEATGDTPGPVDALSTADKVVWAKQMFGAYSSEYHEARQGLLLDSQRLVGEWYRKKTSEYFEPIKHTWNAELQDYISHGFSTGQITENGIIPMANDLEDEARRVNDKVEDATPKILMSLGCVALGEGVALRTISQCTEQAKQAYEADMAAGRKYAGYKGYVPDADKLYIRDYTFDPVTADRYEEVVGLPGTYINDYVIREALRIKDVAAGHMDRTELQGAQFLAPDSLIDFVAHLDAVASEQWCTNIFMGEEVPADFVKDYARFQREALQRQEQLAGLGEVVAAFVVDLAEDGYDRTKAPAKVEAFVKMHLLELGKHDYKVARADVRRRNC
jgi:hypothetical protein